MNSLKQDLILRFLRAFLAAITHVQQYTTAHQMAVASIDTAYRYLVEATGQSEGLPLLFVDDRIVIDREPLEDSLYSGRFTHHFRSKGIHHITFLHEITLEEMTSFIEVFAVNPKGLADTDLFPHIRFGKASLRYDFDVEADSPEDENYNTGNEDDQDAFPQTQHFKVIQQQDMDLMVGVYDAVRSNGHLPDHDIRLVVSDIISAIKQDSSILLNFSPLRVLDEYSFTHSVNVCILAIAQALALKIKDEVVHDIGVAAMLHDIGKIFIPLEVLNKPGKLTNQEFDLIKKHPQMGAEYLLNKPGIPPLAAIVAYEHHMLYDYSGYPKVSANWQQNICSQMTTISDIFDALRSKRVYRDSVEMADIFKQMGKMSGATLEPFLSQNFLCLVKNMVKTLESAEQTVL